jgi:23S rRNA pseudouridine2605 synthase
MLERLQKILSARGIASRRKAEEYIEAGLVKVNGVVAKIGDKADPDTDTIEVDGKVTEERKEMLYYLMNKPTGVITTNVARSAIPFLKKTPTNAALQKVPTVRDLIPEKFRGLLYPVGRLDKDSSGLLLLTNDGPLAFRLTHPKFEHEKEYEVETRGNITDDALEKMSAGRMSIDGALIKPVFIRRIGPFRFRITLTEGKNRQIRRMCEKVGFPVVTLKRVRIMMLEDASLKPGAMRPLTDTEKKDLLKATGL